MGACLGVGNAGVPPSNKVNKTEVWFDIAMLVTALGLAALAIVAFLGVGSFASMGATANHLAWGASGAATILLSAELIHAVMARSR